MISETFLCSFFSWTKSLQGASLVAQTVKNLPVMQETQVQSLDQEDPLGKGMATHSSILAWEIPWTEEPGRLQSMGSQRVRHNRETEHSTARGHTYFRQLLSRTVVGRGRG